MEAWSFQSFLQIPGFSIAAIVFFIFFFNSFWFLFACSSLALTLVECISQEFDHRLNMTVAKFGMFCTKSCLHYAVSEHRQGGLKVQNSQGCASLRAAAWLWEKVL